MDFRFCSDALKAAEGLFRVHEDVLNDLRTYGTTNKTNSWTYLSGIRAAGYKCTHKKNIKVVVDLSRNIVPPHLMFEDGWRVELHVTRCVCQVFTLNSAIFMFSISVHSDSLGSFKVF